MVSKFLLALVFSLVWLFPFQVVLAEDNFATTYAVTYDVDASGLTTVDEDVTLKNLTDKYFASSFALTISSTTLSDIQASDKDGPLESSVEKNGNKTKVSVKFKQEVVGQDKEYKWNLKFKSKDFAQNQGKIWQVTVPRLPQLASNDKYSLTLSVPVAFGDPATIIPQPVKQIESGGRVLLSFSQGQLKDQGVIANFGTQQVFQYKLTYELKNDNVLPAIAKLPLPPDTNYQQVIINNITPRPDNVLVDNDGNYIAMFKIAKLSSQNVVIDGLARLNLQPSRLDHPLDPSSITSLTNPQKYWESDNPAIKQKLQDILSTNPKITDTTEKARLIYKYVVTSLVYNDGRVSKNDFDRLGAVTALNNPDQALCSEYADLLIALLRAAHIPARRLEGYAYTANSDIKPLSLGDTLLHAWVEYYDSSKGWIMVDPTWESTSGRVDYFSHFDLNHIVLAIQGASSTDPSTASKVDAHFTDMTFEPKSTASLQITGSTDYLSGLPGANQLEILNSGNSALLPGDAQIDSPLVSLTKFSVPVIPPYGHVVADLSIKSAFNQSGQYQIAAIYADQKVSKNIYLKPFYAYPLFLAVAIVVPAGMVGLYLLSLALHLKSNPRYVKPLASTVADKILPTIPKKDKKS